MQEYMYQIIARLLIVVTLLPVHEFAHAWAARMLGDETANYSGRFTLNPLAHLDPIGSILLVFTGFGWAKPVPINPRNFKNQKVGMGLSALAGPVSNIIVSYVLLLLCKILTLFPVMDYSYKTIEVFFIIQSILSYMAYISVVLAVFNLIPVPPLDGSRVIGMLLPDRIYFKIMQYERYISIAIMLLAFAGAFSVIISPVSSFLYNLLFTLAGL